MKKTAEDFAHTINQLKGKVSMRFITHALPRGCWWMGFGAHRVAQRYKKNSFDLKALDWLRRLGPKACLLAWLPLVGDPLCSVAGWLKMPFWPCVAYMAIGKFLRYTVMTIALIGLASLW